MHIMSAPNLCIHGKHVGRSADCLARTAGIPAVKGGPEPRMVPSQLWNGCPFVEILNLPGRPSQSAPFLLIGGRSVTHPSCWELSTGAAFVIGMLPRFS